MALLANIFKFTGPHVQGHTYMRDMTVTNASAWGDYASGGRIFHEMVAKQRESGSILRHA
ncbi:hypothetical protein CFR71_00270 [Novacetimonas pomaceti]|uniref:Uncharacterized protein n=1 Tax=Novacetimonas pomaceti TaxID=2021998 RepID=A0A318QVL3_9PROT|nr:hypothetical protein CFR71_00270 [Novacetimonas pomaceti]